MTHLESRLAALEAKLASLIEATSVRFDDQIEDIGAISEAVQRIEALINPHAAAVVSPP